MSDDGQGIALSSAGYGALIGLVYSYLCGASVGPAVGRRSLRTGQLGAAAVGGALTMGLYGAGVGLFIQADRKQSSGDKDEGVREENCAIGILAGMLLAVLFSALAGDSASRYSRDQRVLGFSSMTALGGLFGGLIGYYWSSGDSSSNGSSSSDPDWGFVLAMLVFFTVLGYFLGGEKATNAGLGFLAGVIVLLAMSWAKNDDSDPPAGGKKQVAFKK